PWPARELSKLAADRQRPEINADEADAVDERRHLRLRGTVIAGIEQHAPAAVRPRVPGEPFGAEMIECLDDACARHKIGDDLARYPALQIDRFEQRRLYGV